MAVRAVGRAMAGRGEDRCKVTEMRGKEAEAAVESRRGSCYKEAATKTVDDPIPRSLANHRGPGQ